VVKTPTEKEITMNINEKDYNIDKVTVNGIDITHEYCGTSQCCGECEGDTPVQLELFEEKEYINPSKMAISPE